MIIVLSIFNIPDILYHQVIKSSLSPSKVSLSPPPSPFTLRFPCKPNHNRGKSGFCDRNSPVDLSVLIQKLLRHKTGKHSLTKSKSKHSINLLIIIQGKYYEIVMSYCVSFLAMTFTMSLNSSSSPSYDQLCITLFSNALFIIFFKSSA